MNTRRMVSAGAHIHYEVDMGKSSQRKGADGEFITFEFSGKTIEPNNDLLDKLLFELAVYSSQSGL